MDIKITVTFIEKRFGAVPLAPSDGVARIGMLSTTAASPGLRNHSGRAGRRDTL